MQQLQQDEEGGSGDALGAAEQREWLSRRRASWGVGRLLILLLGAGAVLLLEGPFGHSGGTLMWTKRRAPTPSSRLSAAAARRREMGLPPGAECGTDYRTMVEGGPNATALPVCTRQQLEEDAATVYRARDEGHVQFPHCRLRWFDAEEACELLERHDVVLAMVGDSLVRHVTQALLTIMTDDYTRGGHTWWEQDAATRAICQCDAPFDDLATTCRFYSASFYLKGQSVFCPQWTRRRVIFHEKVFPFVLTPSPGETAPNDLVALLQDASIRRPFVYLNFGIHLNFDREAGRDGYLEPLFALVRSAAWQRRRQQQEQQEQEQQQQQRAGPGEEAHPPHILLATFPYPGRRKNLDKYPRQGRENVAQFNSFLRDFQAAHAGESTLIDYAPISDHSFSGDGTHFLQDTNVIMAQFVLNHVAARVGV